MGYRFASGIRSICLTVDSLAVGQRLESLLRKSDGSQDPPNRQSNAREVAELWPPESPTAHVGEVSTYCVAPRHRCLGSCNRLLIRAVRGPNRLGILDRLTATLSVATGQSMKVSTYGELVPLTMYLRKSAYADRSGGNTSRSAMAGPSVELGNSSFHGE